MKIAFCVFVLLCLTYVNIVSTFPSNKSCAEFGLVPMKGFVKEEYLGPWFSHQVYDLDFPGYDCYVVTRKPRLDGNVDVIDVLIKPDGIPEFSTNGMETYNYPGEGRYVYSSNGAPQYNGGEYIILKTDYISYYIESRCTDVSGGSLVELYVFSRLPIVPFFTQKEIDKVIKDHGFNTTAIMTMDIFSCPSKLIGGVGLLAGVLKLVTNLLGLLGGLLGGVLRAVGGLLGGLLG